MSASELLKNNRLGTIGDEGISFIRTFQVVNPTDDNGVTVDARKDAELRQLAAPGTGLVGLEGAIARSYTLTQTWGTNIFEVVVNYSAPSALNPGLGGRWHMRMFGFSDSEFVMTMPQTKKEVADGVGALVVGPWAYKRFPDIGPAQADERLFNAGKTKRLVMKGDREDWTRKPVGMDRFVSTGTIVYTRIFPDATPRRLTEIINKGDLVNEDRVALQGFGKNTFPRGTLMLTDHEVEEEIGTVFGEAIIHRVSLTFGYRPEGWQHAVVHTYRDEDTADENETPVTYGPRWPDDASLQSKPVIEEFRRQFWTKLNGWMESL